MALSARNSVQPFCESDSRLDSAGDEGRGRRGWKTGATARGGGERRDRAKTVAIFVHSGTERAEGDDQAGRTARAEVESDKWTGFNLRPINILVLSSRASSPCLIRVSAFSSSARLSFAFSRAFATCVEHELCLAPTGTRARSRIFLLFYDP